MFAWWFIIAVIILIKVYKAKKEPPKTKEQIENELEKKKQEKELESYERWVTRKLNETGPKVKSNSDIYNELLQRPEWLARRTQILVRDHFKCSVCGSTEGLQVHHIEYHVKDHQMVPPWEYDGLYLVTLCSKCHKQAHNNHKIPITYYNSTTNKYEAKHKNC